MKQRRIFLIVSLIIINYQLSIVNCNAQDIHFSQFYASPLTLNPALAGNFKGDDRAYINYRNQWASVAFPYKTEAASFDAKLLKRKQRNGFLGIGVSIFNDKAGDAQMGTLLGALSLSENRKMNMHNSVSVGLQAAFAQRSINYSKLQWDSQYNGNIYDSGLPGGEVGMGSSFFYFDYAAGMCWYYGQKDMNMTSNDGFKIDMGLSVFHISRPGLSFGAGGERLYPRMVFHTESSVGIKNTNMALRPHILVMRQGPSIEVEPGVAFRYQLRQESKYTGRIKGAAISFGMNYRYGDAFVATTLLELANYGIGMSYDVNASGLFPASHGMGGFEISLRYINPNPFRKAGGDALIKSNHY